MCVDLKGRNITMDRLYTSYELFRYLLNRNMTAVGTIRGNKKCIPNEIKDTSNRSTPSCIFLYDETDEKLNLHSYVVSTKSKGKKNALLLSSMPAIKGTTRDENKEKTAIMNSTTSRKVAQILLTKGWVIIL